jgi:hypothetical protein
MTILPFGSNYLTNQLIYAMEQRYSLPFKEPVDVLPDSQGLATGSYAEPDESN